MPEKNIRSRFFRSVSLIILPIFISTTIVPPSYAQAIRLPIAVVPINSFVPTHIKGLTVHPEDPLQFDFIVDQGNESLDQTQLKDVSTKLVKYFLASLTVPEKEMWVNLSPVEKDRIISDGLGETELGKDLLGQDFLLKKLSASLLSPDNKFGQEFWVKIRSKLQKDHGIENADLNSFNKVWIVPDAATVYEQGNSVFVLDSHLKVMMEEDYVSQIRHSRESGNPAKSLSLDPRVKSEDDEKTRLPRPNGLAMTEENPRHEGMTQGNPRYEGMTQGNPRYEGMTEVMKEIILPAIEEEVNHGKTFANLRQIYSSMILAVWYKENLKQSLLSQVYVDQNKVQGIEHNEEAMAQKLYDQYLELFRTCVNDVIKEEYDPSQEQVVSRHYFTGGLLEIQAKNIHEKDHAELNDVDKANLFSAGSNKAAVTVNLYENQNDKGLVAEDPSNDQLLEVYRLSNFEGLQKIPFKNVPEWVKNLLAFYGSTGKDVQLQRLQSLLADGKLFANPDPRSSFRGVSDNETVIIATNLLDENTFQKIKADTLYIRSVTSELEGEFKAWESGLTRSSISTLARHTQGVVATLIQTFQELGIFDLMKDGRMVTVNSILSHLKRNYSVNEEKSRGYLEAALSELAALGWIKWDKGSKDPMVMVRLTEKGNEAVKYADKFSQAAGFINEAMDMMFTIELANRKEHPITINPFKSDLRSEYQKYEKELKGFGYPQSASTSSMLPELAKLIQNNWGMDNTDPELQELIGQLTGFIIGPLMVTLYENGIFEKFGGGLTLDLEDIDGDFTKLKAIFDIMAHEGYVTVSGQEVKLTAKGSAYFARALSHGVPSSYYPTYKIFKDLLLGKVDDIKRTNPDGTEALVFRTLNVHGSGKAHEIYFAITNQIVRDLVDQKMEKIPTPEELTARGETYEFSVADTGAGDGKFLESIYNVVVNHTKYGEYMRQYPHLYSLRLVGIDYNPEPRRETEKTIKKLSESDRDIDVKYTVIFGDINDPEGIQKELTKNGISKLIDIHVNSMLIHNRPYTGVVDKEAAQKRIKAGAYSKGTFVWRGRAIPNGELEQNLYELFQNWGKIAREMIVIELHTITEEMSANNLTRTLNIPYQWSHALSDQLAVEQKVSFLIAREAGFTISKQKLFPADPDLGTVSVGVYTADKAVGETASHSDKASDNVKDQPWKNSRFYQEEKHPNYLSFLPDLLKRLEDNKYAHHFDLNQVTGKVVLVGPGKDLGEVVLVANKFPNAEKIMVVEWHDDLHNFDVKEWLHKRDDRIEVYFKDAGNLKDVVDENGQYVFGDGSVEMVLMSRVFAWYEDLKRLGDHMAHIKGITDEMHRILKLDGIVASTFGETETDDYLKSKNDWKDLDGGRTSGGRYQRLLYQKIDKAAGGNNFENPMHDKSIFKIGGNLSHIPSEVEWELSKNNNRVNFAQLMPIVNKHFYDFVANIGLDANFRTYAEDGFFSDAMVEQLFAMWKNMGHSQKFDIVEMGAGSGELAAHIMQRAFDRHPEFYDAIKYTIIDIGGKQIGQQQGKLYRFEDKVHVIHKSVTDIDDNDLGEIEGVFLSNELVDDLPGHLIKKIDGELREVYLVNSDGELKAEPGELSSNDLLLKTAYLKDVLKENQEILVRPILDKWFKNIAAHLKKGFVITIDYGGKAQEIAAKDRPGVSSGAGWKKSINEVIAGMNGGEITAEVNFEELAKAGQDHGFDLNGYVSQFDFLSNLIDTKSISGQDLRDIQNSSAFKVMIQSKNIDSSILLKGLEKTTLASDLQIGEAKTEKVVTNDKAVGGINLDRKYLNLQIKRDGKGVPLPLLQQPIGNMKIDGFMPVIIKIEMIPNFPLYLGFNTDGSKPAKHGQEQGAFEVSPLFFKEGTKGSFSNSPNPSLQKRGV